MGPEKAISRSRIHDSAPFTLLACLVAGPTGIPDSQHQVHCDPPCSYLPTQIISLCALHHFKSGKIAAVLYSPLWKYHIAIWYFHRGEICQCRHCRRQCKIFAVCAIFSIFTNLFVFLSPKVLKFGEIKGVKFLARKFGGLIFLTNLMSIWPNLIFAQFPHCNYKVKLEMGGRIMDVAP